LRASQRSGGSMSRSNGRPPEVEDAVDEYRQALVEAIARRDRWRRRARHLVRAGAVMTTGLACLGGLSIAASAILPNANFIPFLVVEAPTPQDPGERLSRASMRLIRSNAEE